MTWPYCLEFVLGSTTKYKVSNILELTASVACFLPCVLRALAERTTEVSDYKVNNKTISWLDPTYLRLLNKPVMGLSH